MRGTYQGMTRFMKQTNRIEHYTSYQNCFESYWLKFSDLIFPISHYRSNLYYSLNKSFNIKTNKICNVKKYKTLLLISPLIGFVAFPLLLCEAGVVCNDLIASLGGWLLLLYGVPVLGWLLARKINEKKRGKDTK
ncbi:MAG: hypothetical protein WD966_06960 [Nitrosopumilaceae archaeon]